MQKKPNWLLIIGLSLGGLCLLGCVAVVALFLFSTSKDQASLDKSSLATGVSAPDFELTALNGGTVRLSGYRGHPVLLSISTTWCPDCRSEAPILENIHKAHPELAVLSVDSGERSMTVQNFVQAFGITYPVLLDTDGKVSNLYQIMYIPTNLFIDKDGIIQAKIVETVTPQLMDKFLPQIGITP